MAKKRHEPSLEEMRARIIEIVSTMSEFDLKRFLVGLEKWRRSKFGEEREHARKDLSLYALWWLGDRFFRDYIMNISAGGLFIETKIPVTVGETVLVSFSPSDKEDPIQIKGEIVRVKYNGFGVKFNEPLTAFYP
jgi:hypothetical protein